MTRKKAIRIAIQAMEEKRKEFTFGHNAYLLGLTAKFIEKDHKKYLELSEAIELLK
jgi:hypothetical protein